MFRKPSGAKGFPPQKTSGQQRQTPRKPGFAQKSEAAGSGSCRWASAVAHQQSQFAALPADHLAQPVRTRSRHARLQSSPLSHLCRPRRTRDFSPRSRTGSIRGRFSPAAGLPLGQAPPASDKASGSSSRKRCLDAAMAVRIAASSLRLSAATPRGFPVGFWRR